MQLLFEESHEYGCHKGLGLINGKIASIQEDLRLKNGNEMNLKVPHIGWNKLIMKSGSEKDPIFKHFKDGGHVYYVHSFYARDCIENTIASSNYDLEIPGIVRYKNVYGMQFHPEKSGEVGLGLLKAFANPL
jgi:imidazole glycerol-phosphate synthase subunit HisH